MEDQATQVLYVPSEGEDWRFIEVDDNLTVEVNQTAFTNGVAASTRSLDSETIQR